MEINEAIRAMDSRYSEYEKDESRLGGNAQSISFPETLEDMDQILRELISREIAVTAQGSRTGITGAAVPLEGHILNLSRLNLITGLSRREESYVLKLHPGVLLGDVLQGIQNKAFDTKAWDSASQQCLKEWKRAGDYFFPPDPTERTATLGGMFACNAAGMNASVYGKTADYVEKVSVFLSSGAIWEIKRGEFCFDAEGCPLPDGGFFRVAPVSKREDRRSPLIPYEGMDLIELFAGSEGMLGIVRELEIRVIPQRSQRWGVICFFDQMQQGIAFAERARALSRQIDLSALEFFDANALKWIQQRRAHSDQLKHLPDMDEQTVCAVYAAMDADREEAMEDALDALLSLLDECGGQEEHTWAAVGGEEIEQFQAFRHAAPEAVNAKVDENRLQDTDICKLAADYSAPDEHWGELVNLYLEDIRKSGIEGTVFGHVRKCHLHVNLLPRDKRELVQAESILEEWGDRILEWGGSLIEENGVGKAKRRAYFRMMTERERRTAIAVKKYFDPKGLFNPGNML